MNEKSLIMVQEQHRFFLFSLKTFESDFSSEKLKILARDSNEEAEMLVAIVF